MAGLAAASARSGTISPSLCGSTGFARMMIASASGLRRLPDRRVRAVSMLRQKCQARGCAVANTASCASWLCGSPIPREPAPRRQRR
jgi:hypothetical protein